MQKSHPFSNLKLLYVLYNYLQGDLTSYAQPSWSQLIMYQKVKNAQSNVVYMWSKTCWDTL